MVRIISDSFSLQTLDNKNIDCINFICREIEEPHWDKTPYGLEFFLIFKKSGRGLRGWKLVWGKASIIFFLQNLLTFNIMEEFQVKTEYVLL